MTAAVYLMGLAGLMAAAHRAYQRPGEQEAAFRANASPRVPRTHLVLLFAAFGVAWAARLSSLGDMGEQPWLGAVLLGLEAVVASAWALTMWVVSRPLKSRASVPVEVEPLVLIPTCDERADVLTRSVAGASRQDLPARVVIVDNSRTEAGHQAAERVAARWQAERLVVPNRGHKAGALNDALAILRPTVPVAVLDADQRPEPSFLRRVTGVLLADPRLAFVQAPQLAENAELSWVARAANQQEMFQYDAIAPGRDALDLAPCCGSNVVFRPEALAEGFDERSVSEDAATAWRLHRAGWKSAYLREALVWGLAPENLSAWRRQQTRWSRGSSQLLRLMWRDGRGPWLATLLTAWSASFYWVTCALAVLAVLPVGIWLLGGELLRPEWIATLAPLYAVVLSYPYALMRRKGYRLANLAMVQGLMPIGVPLWARASLAGLFGGSTRFERTRAATAAAPDRALALLVVAVPAVALLLSPEQGRTALLFWALWQGFSGAHLALFAERGPVSGALQVMWRGSK